MVRFAVIGAGYMGGNHVKKILSVGPRIGAKVSVIVEPDELRAEALIRSLPAVERPKIISNIGLLETLGSEHFPEAAIVAVPASIHVETASACLAKGLHCLVEKPLGFTTFDVKDLAAKAKKAHRLIQVGLLERGSLAHMWKDWSPTKGPWTLNAVRSGPFVPRAADVDVIHDLMIHDIDLFVLLDSVFKLAPIKKVRAWGRKLRSSHLDYAIAALDLEDGGMVRFFASRLSAEISRSWEMTGPDWHASADFLRRTLKRFERVGKSSDAFQATETHWSGGDPLAWEIEAFVRRIRGEKGVDLGSQYKLGASELLIPTGETVLRCHEIMDQILSCVQVLRSEQS